MKKIISLLLGAFVFQSTTAQTVQQKINQFTTTNEKKLMDEYVQFVSIPNVTKDTANILLNVAFIKTMME